MCIECVSGRSEPRNARHRDEESPPHPPPAGAQSDVASDKRAQARRAGREGMRERSVARMRAKRTRWAGSSRKEHGAERGHLVPALVDAPYVAD